ncbi:uncharacterized protein LY89DRAFT_717883 [Mollisia scopiformis]|uniref:CENP-V/GFA domain-containing protein n=1 Tax=Mollisia scopiformis TaxID=149040 RepID=A0A194XDS8_MOLSC|nr:uncharacterized protein LY89DRAFT_717883 [Mollisia scopiformis]KUJ18306.1 hypothetical protein LY89DRAFT_717883 [Mollisia scopiformis]
MATSDLKTYKGNCHCGKFRFEIDVPPIEKVESCNCSICVKKGYLWTFLAEKRFRVTKGAEDELTSYWFGSKTMPHKFCPICGTSVMLRKMHPPREDEEIYVNVRTLTEVNPFHLNSKKFDGKNIYPDDGKQSLKDEPPKIDAEDSNIYTGGCHCGAVTLVLKSGLLSEIQIKEDNCSICRRHANVCIHPKKSQVTISGGENTTEYLFGRKFTGHCFCKICGVPLFMRLHGPPKELVDTWSEDKQNMVKEKLEIIPIRLAVLDDVNWDELKIERSDEGTEGYVVD